VAKYYNPYLEEAEEKPKKKTKTYNKYLDEISDEELISWRWDHLSATRKREEEEQRKREEGKNESTKKEEPKKEEPKKTTKKSEDKYEKSKDSPKNFGEAAKLYGEAITSDPLGNFGNIARGMLTKDRARKMRGDTLILERKEDLGSLDYGDKSTHVDHKIPLSLGGSNAHKNLQILSAEDNKEKAKYEKELEKLLASKEITKKEARKRMEVYNANLNAKPVEDDKSLVGYLEKAPGAAEDVAGGLIGSTWQMGSRMIGGLSQEYGESMRVVGYDPTKGSIFGPLGNMLSIGTFNMPGGKEQKKQFTESEMAKKISSWGENFTKVQEGKLSESEFAREKAENPFLYDVAAGFGSAATALLATLATKNPATAMALFGSYANSNHYIESRAAGSDPEQAAVGGGRAQVVEAGLEALDVPFIKAGGKFLIKTAKRALIESFQEFSQEVGGNIIAMTDYDNPESWSDAFKKAFDGALYSALIGGIVGGGTSIVGDFGFKNGMKEHYENSGLSKEESEVMAEDITMTTVEKIKEALGISEEQNIDETQDPLAEASPQDLVEFPTEPIVKKTTPETQGQTSPTDLVEKDSKPIVETERTKVAQYSPGQVVKDEYGSTYEVTEDTGDAIRATSDTTGEKIWISKTKEDGSIRFAPLEEGGVRKERVKITEGVKKYEPKGKPTLKAKDGVKTTQPTSVKGGVDKYLYHGTADINMDSIAKEGLKPGLTSKRISLSKTEPYATSFAESSVVPSKQGQGAVLRVNTDLIDGKTRTGNIPTGDKLNELVTNKAIPPEALEIKVNGKWQPLSQPTSVKGGVDKVNIQAISLSKPKPKKKTLAKIITPKKAVDLVTSAISKRSSLDVLKGVLVKGKDLYATNLETFIIYHGDKDLGNKIVDGDSLKSVGLENIGGLKEMMEASEFPVLPEITKEVGTLDNFESELSGALTAVAKDETRPVLSGVHFLIKDGVLSVAATDSYKLYVNQSKTSIKGDHEFIMAQDTAKKLGRILKEGGKVKVYRDNNILRFTVGKFDVYGREVDGQFPKYQDKQILPEKTDKAFTADPKELTEILKKAKGKAKMAEFDVEKGEITVRLTDEENSEFTQKIKMKKVDGVGTSQESDIIMPIRDGTGDFSVNAEYLINAMKRYGSPVIGFGSNMSPLVIKEKSDSSKLIRQQDPIVSGEVKSLKTRSWRARTIDDAYKNKLKYVPGRTTIPQELQLEFSDKGKDLSRAEMVKNILLPKGDNVKIMGFGDLPISVKNQLIRYFAEDEGKVYTLSNVGKGLQKTGGLYLAETEIGPLIALADKRNDFTASHEIAHHIWETYLDSTERYNFSRIAEAENSSIRKEKSRAIRRTLIEEYYADKFGEYSQEYLQNKEPTTMSERALVFFRKLFDRIKKIFGKQSQLRPHFEYLMEGGLKNGEAPEFKISKVGTRADADAPVVAFSRRLLSRKEQKAENDLIKRRSEIVNDLSKALSIPIRTGKIRGRALGIFKERPEVIRSRVYGDISTIAHEVGHLIDKKLFGMSRMKGGLQNLPPSYAKELYAVATKPNKSSNKTMEGFAEYISMYITKPEVLNSKFPLFHPWFESQIQKFPEIHDVILSARDDYARWESQPATAKVMSQISQHPEKHNRISLDRLYTLGIDDLNPLKTFVDQVQKTTGQKIQIEDNPYILARLNRGWAGRAEVFLQNHTFNHDFKNTGKSLNEILGVIDENNEIDVFDAYLISRRVVALKNQNRDIKTGISQDDAKATIAELEQKHPHFKETSEELYRFNDRLLDYAMEGGLLTKKIYNALKQEGLDYVPLFRVIERMSYAGKTSAGVSSPIKRLKGSGKEIISPTESIIKNVYSIINAADRNIVARKFADIADKSEGIGGMIEKIPNPLAKVATVTAEELGVDLVDPQTGEFLDADQTFNIFRPQVNVTEQNIISVLRDGKPSYYQVDPDLYNALMNLDQEQTNIILRILAKPARMLRVGATVTPDFSLRNPMRDQFSAMVYSNYGFIPGYDLGKGIASFLKQDENYTLWKMAGGEHSMLVSFDREHLQKTRDEVIAGKRLPNVVKHPIEALRLLSEYGEAGTRIGEFSKGIKKTGTTKQGILEAGFSSREVTLDFGRIGAKTRAINQIQAFWNANIQDIDKVRREFKTHPVRMNMKAILGITLPSMILYFVNRDDDRYKELPAWQKNTFWIVPIGDTLVRIPKPFLLGSIYGSFPERVMEYLDNNDPKGLSDLAGNMFGGLIGLPTALDPIVENITNYSFFQQRKLIPSSEEKLLPEDQYGMHTSELAKLIGKITKTSPRKVSNLIQGYSGGLGRYAEDSLSQLVGLFTKPPQKPTSLADVPFIKAFIARDPVGSNSNTVNSFYDELSKSSLIYMTTSDRIKNGREVSARDLLRDPKNLEYYQNYLAMNRASRDMAAIKGEIERTLREDISKEEKKKRIREYDIKLMDIAKNWRSYMKDDDKKTVSEIVDKIKGQDEKNQESAEKKELW